MIHFFNRTVNRSETGSVVPAVILAVVVIIAIAIPLVNFLIWLVLEVFGVELTPDNAYIYVGPFATIVTVIVILLPVIASYRKIFQEIINERQKAEHAQARAEQLLAQREEFVAYVSHEIRNPLNGITGIVGTIDLDPLPLEARRGIEIIKKSADDLTFILNDILDLAKVDAGKLTLQPVNTSLRQTVRQIYDFWVPVAQDSNLTLNLYICETFPDYVNIDVQRFRQVCNNLVSNAIKYSDAGTILISADCDFENMRAMVSVKDTGLGIPAALQERIFEPFEQAQNRNAERPKTLGTGLGLPIARKIARMMEGDVILESSSSSGSKFVFSFGVEPVDVPQELQVSDDWLHKQLDGKHALIVEHSMANALVLREQLKNFGVQSTMASSGKDGLGKMDAERFDFIFVDDYISAANLEHVKTEKPANCRLICYSSQNSYANVTDILNSGFDGIITKPVVSNDVHHALVRILHRGESSDAQKSSDEVV